MLDQAFEIAPDLVAVAAEKGGTPPGALATLDHEGKVLAILPRKDAAGKAEGELFPVLRHAQTGELAVATGRFSVRWSADTDRKPLGEALEKQGFVIVRDYGAAGAVASKARPGTGLMEQMKTLEGQPGISSAEPELLRLRSKR